MRREHLRLSFTDDTFSLLNDVTFHSFFNFYVLFLLSYEYHCPFFLREKLYMYWPEFFRETETGCKYSERGRERGRREGGNQEEPMFSLKAGKSQGPNLNTSRQDTFSYSRERQLLLNSAFKWLDEDHPLEGGQSALLNLFIWLLLFVSFCSFFVSLFLSLLI